MNSYSDCIFHRLSEANWNFPKCKTWKSKSRKYTNSLKKDTKYEVCMYLWISNIMNCLCLDHKSPSLCLSSYFLASISHTAIGFLAPPSSRQYYELFTLEAPITPPIPLFLYSPIFEKILKTANEVFWGDIQCVLYTQR